LLCRGEDPTWPGPAPQLRDGGIAAGDASRIASPGPRTSGPDPVVHSTSVATMRRPRRCQKPQITGAVLANSKAARSRSGGMVRDSPRGRRMSWWWIISSTKAIPPLNPPGNPRGWRQRWASASSCAEVCGWRRGQADRVGLGRVKVRAGEAAGQIGPGQFVVAVDMGYHNTDPPSRGTGFGRSTGRVSTAQGGRAGRLVQRRHDRVGHPGPRR